MSPAPRTIYVALWLGKYPQANLLRLTGGRSRLKSQQLLGNPTGCASILVTYDRIGPRELASLRLRFSGSVQTSNSCNVPVAFFVRLPLCQNFLVEGVAEFLLAPEIGTDQARFERR